MSAKYDYLHWSQDSQTPRRLCSPSELPLYTNTVYKANKRNHWQPRFLVLTNAFIYNFKKATFGGVSRLWAIELGKLEAVATNFEEGELVLLFAEREKCDYLYRANAREVLEVLATARPGLVFVKADADSLVGFRRRKGERRSFNLDVFRNKEVRQVEPEAGQAVLIYAAHGGICARDLLRYTKVSKGENTRGEMVIKLFHSPKYLYFQSFPKTYMALEALLKANQSRHQFGPLQFILSTPAHFSLYYDYRLNSQIMRVLTQMDPAEGKTFLGKVAYSLALQLDKLHKIEQLFGPWTSLHIQVSPDLSVTLQQPKPDPLALSIAVNEVEYAEYMAPELLLQGEYWAISDWWSLGVVLWEMMLGKQPFVDSPDLLEAIVNANGLNIPDTYREMRPLLALLVRADQRTAISSIDILRDPCMQQYAPSVASR